MDHSTAALEEMVFILESTRASSPFILQYVLQEIQANESIGSQFLRRGNKELWAAKVRHNIRINY